ncbi:MAG: hypothetical protein V1492_03150 [Candidatus Micrarchaeota archaeon]
MAEISQTATVVKGGGFSGLILLLLGLLLGAGIMFSLFYFLGPGCSSKLTLFGTSKGTYINQTTILQDASGKTLALPGQLGEVTTFTDPNGNRKDVICYTSVYCVDKECPTCGNQTCGECLQQGDTCGFSGTPLTTLSYRFDASAYRGSCCEGMACIRGTCQPPSNNCELQDQPCGNGPQIFTAANIPQADYGSCCQGYQCIDGACRLQTCVKTGGTCTSASECCENGCVNGICQPPSECVGSDQRCGYGPSTTITALVPNQSTFYGNCCEGYQCVSGYCSREGTCVQNEQMCGAGPTNLATAMVMNYGNCCNGSQCINGVCGASCKKSGQCSGQSDCCSGYYCSDNMVCTPAQQCAGTSQYCGVDSDCCSGLFCLNSACNSQRCLDNGNKCSASKDCCSGLCRDGVCIQACKTTGSCTSTADCCSGYYCSDNLVCTKTQTCGDTGATCSPTANTCCSGLSCVNGICGSQTCKTSGGSCKSSTECCSNYYCSANYVCTTCSTSYCTSDEQCCSGFYCNGQNMCTYRVT